MSGKYKGLSESEYWRQYVKSKEDIVKFYELYYPQYPQYLSEAIATRMEEVVAKAQSGGTLSEEEKAYFIDKKKYEWDYEEEIRKQELAGKINVALSRLQKLETE